MNRGAANGVPIFVSHVSGEAKVAALVRKLVDEEFPGEVAFFTSTDVGTIRAGRDWLQAITEAIGRAKAMIVLCSRDSVQKPWVQFEIGAAWIKGIPIIPVCHSGLEVLDLPQPLSRLEGLALGTEAGLGKLYEWIAATVKRKTKVVPRNVNRKLDRVRAVEAHFRCDPPHQFELYLDVELPAPGHTAAAVIPDGAKIHSDARSLKLFGLEPDSRRTWKDIVDATSGTPDKRWIDELAKCIHLAGRKVDFKAVQAVYHAETASYQPQLARRESLPGGACRFHVHFVETTVAPLFEVPNEFGLLATMLRLGLRFRYEVIERAPRLVGPGQIDPQTGRDAHTELLAQVRNAIEVIETDARSRGSQDFFNRGKIAALFDNRRDVDEMTDIQLAWDESRRTLFRTDPPPDVVATNHAIETMRRLNSRFMILGTRRFHEMANARWAMDSQSPLSFDGALAARAAEVSAASPPRSTRKAARRPLPVTA